MTEEICGAKTAAGLCQGKLVSGKKRCFRHGGAPGSGAPLKSQNAYKHGRRSKAVLEAQKQANMLKRRIILDAKIAQLFAELKGVKGKTLHFK